jgi:Flp pilus assembly protein TadD
MRSPRPRRQHRPVPQPAANRPSNWLAFALVVTGAGVATFWNSLSAPFIWDDQIAIVTNRTIQRIWPLWETLVPPHETPVAGRPLVNLSFAVNYAIGGLSETGYHAVNIAIHIACALLLLGIVRRSLSRAAIPAALGSGADGTALAVALVWLVHPLQSEVVDYVTQRSESMMALFFLLTLYCAIRADDADDVEGGGSVSNRQRWTIGAVLACAAGMASKESMVAAPIIVVLYDWAFAPESFRERVRSRKALYAGLASTWLLLALIEWNTQRSTVGASATVGRWTYLVNQIQIISRYLRLSVWPDALVLDYGLPRQIGLADVLPSAAVLTAILAATGVALVRWPRIGFLAAAFFITLAPTSSFVPIVSEVGAERRMYLPLAALVSLLVVGIGYALSRGPTVLRRRYAAVAVAAFVCVPLAIRTALRNAEYSDPVRLWTTVVERYPHGRARMSLATELVSAGQHEQAIALLREAVPDFPDARAALGTELVVQGRSDEGVSVLRRFIAADPTRANRIPAHVLIGETMMSQGKFEDAAKEWRAVAAIAPSDAGARLQLTRTLIAQAQQRMKQGDVRGGQSIAREAVEMAPANADAQNLLGAAFASAGDLASAIPHFQEAVRLAPNDSQARDNLERALRLTSTSPPRPRSDGSGPR